MARANDGSARGVVWAILLVAAGLRLFLLDGQSLWYDEGVSAYMTPRSFAEIAAATAVDIHPPLYYWLLASWAAVFGPGEIALRGLSVIFGTLTVWVTWRLGHLVGGRGVGLAAAALLAVSPLAVQYSQEVRMYALAGLLAAGSSWAGLALLRALTDEAPAPRRLVQRHGEDDGTAALRRLPLSRVRERGAGGEGWTPIHQLQRGAVLALLAVSYGLLTGGLLYTHYYGTLVVAAQQLFAALTLVLTRRWQIVPWWGLASGLAAVLFLPWLPVALRQTGYYPGLGSPHPAWALVLDAVNVLSIGIATTRFGFRAGLAPFLGLAALGAAWLWRRGDLTPPPPLSAPERGETRPISPSPHGRGGWGVRSLRAVRSPAMFLLFWLVLPIAGIVILSQTRPLYEPRFLMLILPAWTILLGAGLVALGQAAGSVSSARFGLPPQARQLVVVAVAVVVAGLLVIPTARSLASYYFDPAYARDDYRGLVRTVTLREQPGDAIILTAPGQIEIFGYYYGGRSDLFPLPLQRPIDPSDTSRRLEALADDHDRVWLVRWAANEADPDDLILGWLEGRGRRLGSQDFGRVELRLYDLRGIAHGPPSSL